ncbi:uncharacterized protein LOC129575904 [Sitodiplosis mosellana]|uniref:uncharacterized protein LOC129575904 n=1 Tax=Sitodiplosis mosellana TaxID=263140 RepID=UPI0024450728|nr:uncharacterized protein LOC129575904 [Sitodiplosis mosellana]
MASKILEVKNPIVQDDDIISQQFHTYTPYTTSYNNNDEIRITIQSHELNVLPSESYLLIEFSTAKNDGTPFVRNEAVFAYNSIAHLFSEMRYELNGIEIDRCKSPGITSILKCMIACKSEDEKSYLLFNQYSQQNIVAGSYRVILPLRFIFGFCDDFRKIIMNSKHELILVRSRSNNNFYTSAEDILRLSVTKIHWKIQHIFMSDKAKLRMYKMISHKDSLLLPFRSWDLYELPLVPETTRHTWSVKTTIQVSKPRFVVVAFQTNRNNILTVDSTLFDHCNISNLKLYLNNERYPYDDMHLNFGLSHYQELFYTLQSVQQKYYNDVSFYNPLGVDPENFFTNRPIFVFDCSRTDESMKMGMVDVRLEIETQQIIPNNTAAYCLIIHDNLVEYSPFSSMVHRVI